MAGKRKKQTVEDVRSEIEKLQATLAGIEARQNLGKHEGIARLLSEVSKVAENAKVGEEDVLVQLVMKHSNKPPRFLAKLSDPVEKWKDENATFRHPEDHKKYWWSPDGKGNPPDWLTDLIGKKPDNGKEEDRDAWLDKAEPYRVGELEIERKEKPGKAQKGKVGSRKKAA